MRILSLADKISILVAQAPVSGNALGKAAGFGAGRISKYASGQVEGMKLDTAKAVARAAKIPATYLVTDDPAEYISVWLRHLPEPYADQFRHSGWQQRLKLVWDHLQTMWPGILTENELASSLGVEPNDILRTIDGTSPLEGHMLDELLRAIGMTRSDLIALPDAITPSEATEFLTYLSDMKRLLGVSPSRIKQLISKYAEQLINN